MSRALGIVYNPPELTESDGTFLMRDVAMAVFDSVECLPLTDLGKDEKVHFFDRVLLKLDPRISYETMTVISKYVRGSYINSPEALYYASGKRNLEICRSFVPGFRIFQSVKDIETSLDSFEGVVIKPLSGFGGSGVGRISDRRIDYGDHVVNVAGEETLYKYLCNQLPFLRMKYLDDISSGDRRVILLDGKLVATFVRRAARGSWKANLNLGGKLYLEDFDDVAAMKMCEEVAQRFLRLSIRYVAIDLLRHNGSGWFVSEVNISNIGGWKDLSKADGGAALLDFWERV